MKIACLYAEERVSEHNGRDINSHLANTIMKWIIHVLKQMALKLLVEDLVTYLTL